MKQTGTHKKKEERFNPSGQLLWDRGELERPFVPRSDVHKYTVTAGESKNPKDYRREDWDQPGYQQIKFNNGLPQETTI